jgi:RNA polymerase sigma-70 factor (ECF subfamily)
VSVQVRRDETFEVAFDQLFHRAHRLAYRVLGDDAAAEDVAAEALARTFANWGKVRDLPYRDSWVLKVAANLAIDVTRKRRAVLAAPVPHDVDDETAVRLALVAAMRSLPHRQQQAICLRYLAGLSEAEVAVALGVSAGTVKTHLHRGAAALRKRLGPDFEGAPVVFP